MRAVKLLLLRFGGRFWISLRTGRVASGANHMIRGWNIQSHPWGEEPGPKLSSRTNGREFISRKLPSNPPKTGF